MEHVVDRDGTRTRITIRGVLAEDADFAPILVHVTGEVAIDLASVTRINSSGARQWVNFVRAFPRDAEVALERCSISFVQQVDMIANFLGAASMRSFFVPYVCTACQRPREDLVEADRVRSSGLPAPGPCTSCQGAMEADVIEETYLAFLAD